MSRDHGSICNIRTIIETRLDKNVCEKIHILLMIMMVKVIQWFFGFRENKEILSHTDSRFTMALTINYSKLKLPHVKDYLFLFYFLPFWLPSLLTPTLFHCFLSLTHTKEKNV